MYNNNKFLVNSLRVAIVGEGVIGLSTATAILDLAAKENVTAPVSFPTDHRNRLREKNMRRHQNYLKFFTKKTDFNL